MRDHCAPPPERQRHLPADGRTNVSTTSVCVLAGPRGSRDHRTTTLDHRLDRRTKPDVLSASRQTGEADRRVGRADGPQEEQVEGRGGTGVGEVRPACCVSPEYLTRGAVAARGAGSLRPLSCRGCRVASRSSHVNGA